MAQGRGEGREGSPDDEESHERGARIGILELVTDDAEDPDAEDDDGPEEVVPVRAVDRLAGEVGRVVGALGCGRGSRAGHGLERSGEGGLPSAHGPRGMGSGDEAARRPALRSERRTVRGTEAAEADDEEYEREDAQHYHNELLRER